MSGFGLISALVVILWFFRIAKEYQRETRQEYIRRLNEAVLELEQLRMKNTRLELRLHTMEFIHSLSDKD